MGSNQRNGGSEIEEELSSEEAVVFNGNRDPLESIREEIEGGSVFSRDDDDIVYVVVWGKQSDEATSMDALLWTVVDVQNRHNQSSVVFLVHIFPEIKYIPTPLGKMPVNQVNPEQKEIYMSQERGKRRDFLQKFLNLCSVSQVKVETILIESEMEAKAILDLIPILNIKKLVIGATKSTARRIGSKKGNGVTDQIVQGAPDYCEVNIICDGKQITSRLQESPGPSPSPSPSSSPGPIMDDPTPTFPQKLSIVAVLRFNSTTSISILFPNSILNASFKIFILSLVCSVT